jgi:hypothetical protein
LKILIINPIEMVDPLGLEEEQASEQQENESVVTKVGKLALGGMLGIYETVVPVAEIKETVGLEEGGYYKDQDVETGAMVGRVIGSVLEIGLGFYSIQKGIQTIEAGVGLTLSAPGLTKAAAIAVSGAMVVGGAALISLGDIVMAEGKSDLYKSIDAFKGSEGKGAEASKPKAKTKSSQSKGLSDSETEYQVKKPHVSDKEGAKDIPSWVEGMRPKVGQSGKDFAKEVCDAKYGEGNYKTGPGSEFSKIKKWVDKSFINP